MDMDMMGGFGWLAMGLMWLWILLPLGLVTGAAWLIARAVSSRDGRQRGDDVAAVLDRRLVAGDIDVEQYETARAALGLADRGLHVTKST